MVQDFGASIAPEARGQRRDGFNAEMLAYRLMRRRSQHGCWAAGVIGGEQAKRQEPERHDRVVSS